MSYEYFQICALKEQIAKLEAQLKLLLLAANNQAPCFGTTGKAHISKDAIVSGKARIF